MKIKGCSGLGDAIYLNPVVNYFLSNSDKINPVFKNIQVVSKYPELFAGLNCEVIPEARDIDILCSYVPRKKIIGTNQFQDTCIQAQIPFIDLNLYLDLEVGSHVKNMVEKSKPYIAFVEPYKENIRSDYPLMPDVNFMNSVLKKVSLAYEQNVIKINKFYGYTVHEILYIIKNSEQTIGQVGYIIPASEVYDKKCLAIFSANYKKSTNDFVRTIKPKKVVCKHTTACIYDDEVEWLKK